MDALKPYILSFIPIFVAANALGNLPLFLTLTEHIPGAKRRKVSRDSAVSAALIAIVFLFIGKALFYVIGITQSDFKVAGGILLMVLGIHLLLPGDERRAAPSADVGIFPLATPLVTGPAVLALTIILADSYGYLPVLVSIVLNMFIVWLVFSQSNSIARIMGKGMMKAFSKVGDIILAAIAIMLIRHGLLEIFATIRQ